MSDLPMAELRRRDARAFRPYFKEIGLLTAIVLAILGGGSFAVSALHGALL